LETGDVIWECGGQASNPIPSPVVLNDVVYAMTGFRGYAVYAIPLDAKGDVTGADQIGWRRTDAGPYVSSPVLYQGQLYFTKGRDAVLSSLDAATGEPLIEQVRLPGLNTMYASPVAAADRIYFTSREGATIVLKHGPTFEVFATNRLDEGIDASPAIVGKRMYLRGESHLYCVE
jgi:outer membrane protein assembly factor BamB